MIEGGSTGAVWSSGSPPSILGRMPQSDQAPLASARVRGSERSSQEQTGEEIRAFLIADVRGYTHFTQEHGDEAAAKLASRFAEIVRGVTPAVNFPPR
jgi:class 3 adenylate cyclase